MKITNVTYWVCIIVICNACTSNKSNSIVRKDSLSRYSSNTDTINKNLKYKDTSFEAENYLRLADIHSGPTFDNGGATEHSVFYRIVEVPYEELLSLYIEKISTGDEGGNFQLISRYLLDDKELGINNYTLKRVDSVSFIDSITVSGYFNNIKYRVNLNNKTAIKE